MKQSEEKGKSFRWHPAFYAGIQIELREETRLAFQAEHQLASEPMRANEEGREEGESRFARLSQLLLEADRQKDLLEAATDKAYRQKLFEQYQI